MIIGTAGHVDHGKTALIRQLTDIDTDSLKEEKSRGLTIEPGFAYPHWPEVAELGFIDVPGHERFIHNMISGVAGIDSALLVIAADDGIMPQTREHMAILQLLSIPIAAVTLTKCDLVTPERIDSLKEDIATWLDNSDVPVFPISNRSGEGIILLRKYLSVLANQWGQRPTPGHFRLSIDRVFTKSGAGLVVTGTVVSGQVASGDQLVLLPSQRAVRVRGLRRQNHPAELATRGDRCALNLVGAEREDIKRGDWAVASDAAIAPSTRIDVDLSLLPGLDTPLTHWAPVHVHLGAAHLTGHVGLLENDILGTGERALAQLSLDDPVYACCGDSFIIRTQGADQTLGGGSVLDNQPPRRGARRPERLRQLAILRQSISSGACESEEGFDKAVVDLAGYQGEGIDLKELASTLNRGALQLTDRMRHAGYAVLGNSKVQRMFSRAALVRMELRIVEQVDDFHRTDPSAVGIERDRLRRQTSSRLPPEVFRSLLEKLFTDETLVAHGPFISTPGYQVKLAEEDEVLWQRLEPLLEIGFEPPRVRDIAESEQLDEQRVREVLRANARLGRLYELRQDHYYPAHVVHALAAIVAELEENEGEVRARTYRDRVGVGRKLAIQQLEYFDRIGYTRRVRDAHRIRQPYMWD